MCRIREIFCIDSESAEAPLSSSARILSHVFGNWVFGVFVVRLFSTEPAHRVSKSAGT